QAALRSIRDVSQKFTDEWKLANDVADEIATFSPSALRHADDVSRLQHLLVGSDRAMRNVRVIARRQAEFLVAVRGDAHSTLADALLAARDAVQELSAAVSHEDVDFTMARRKLRLFSSYLTPRCCCATTRRRDRAPPDDGRDAGPGAAGHHRGARAADHRPLRSGPPPLSRRGAVTPSRPGYGIRPAAGRILSG